MSAASDLVDQIAEQFAVLATSVDMAPQAQQAAFDFIAQSFKQLSIEVSAIVARLEDLEGS